MEQQRSTAQEGESVATITISHAVTNLCERIVRKKITPFLPCKGKKVVKGASVRGNQNWTFSPYANQYVLLKLNGSSTLNTSSFLKKNMVAVSGW